MIDIKDKRYEVYMGSTKVYIFKNRLFGLLGQKTILTIDKEQIKEWSDLWKLIDKTLAKKKGKKK